MRGRWRGGSGSVGEGLEEVVGGAVNGGVGGCPRAGDVEDADFVAVEEFGEERGRVFAVFGSDEEVGFAEFFGVLESEKSAAGGSGQVGEYEGGVGLHYVQACAVGVGGRAGFVELVALGEGAVLGFASGGTVAAVGESLGDGPVEGGPVRSRLAAGDDG